MLLQDFVELCHLKVDSFMYYHRSVNAVLSLNLQPFQPLQLKSLSMCSNRVIYRTKSVQNKLMIVSSHHLYMKHFKMPKMKKATSTYLSIELLQCTSSCRNLEPPRLNNYSLINCMFGLMGLMEIGNWVSTHLDSTCLQ